MLEMDNELYELRDSLVTDRTAEDVEAFENGDTDVWKGQYTVEDANRVETAVKALAKKLEGLEAEMKQYAQENGYSWKDEYKLEFESKQAKVTTKTNWASPLEFFDKASAKRYLENVARMCVLLNVPYYTLPPNLVFLDYSGANEIEKLLYQCFVWLEYLIRWKKAQIEGADSFWSYLAYVPCDNADAYQDTNQQIFCVRREALIDYETMSYDDEYYEDEDEMADGQV